MVFLISGLNRAQIGFDKLGFGFELDKSGLGRAQHLRLVNNYVAYCALFHLNSKKKLGRQVLLTVVGHLFLLVAFSFQS